ncbi:hypothetical protein SDC9_138860 [bioreactor metagenome]|uniref:Uncharacterized protein n=1 Tax=bioreactor metagenome TaxID=1076179 RepID=A0A645DRH6_9ZZZZ
MSLGKLMQLRHVGLKPADFGKGNGGGRRQPANEGRAYTHSRQSCFGVEKCTAGICSVAQQGVNSECCKLVRKAGKGLELAGGIGRI